MRKVRRGEPRGEKKGLIVAGVQVDRSLLEEGANESSCDFWTLDVN